MHCKFWGFAYCFFLSFLLLFSSACEFLFIERIGAHGKQIQVLLLLFITKSKGESMKTQRGSAKDQTGWQYCDQRETESNGTCTPSGGENWVCSL